MSPGDSEARLQRALAREEAMRIDLEKATGRIHALELENAALKEQLRSEREIHVSKGERTNR